MAKTNKTIIRLDKVKATAHIESIKFDGDLENGMFVSLGKLASDGEVRVATAPKDVEKDSIVIHASSPLMYNETLQEEDFILVKGNTGRGYVLEVGDVYTITDNGIDGATEVGQFVIPQVGNVKGKASKELTNEKIALEVIAKESLAGYKASVLRVVRA